MLTAEARGRAWIELDRAALEHNVRVLRGMLPERCALMPAVKANAYGHGAVLIAGALQQLGVDAFCVATAEEGAELRQAGIRGLILVLGCTGPGDASLLAGCDLTQTVVSADHAAALNGVGRPLCVHIAVDTGMHRLGIPWDDVPALESVYRMDRLRVGGLYTHLTGAGDAFTRTQIARFYAAADRLRADGLPPGKTHLLGSYGIRRFPAAAGDYARPGIALYGAAEPDMPNLRPVLSLHARITALHRLPPGESAGYDLAFTARRETVLAAASIGYADGLPRCLGEGKGRALAEGCAVPIVGRICMDQCLLDVTDVPGIRAGTEVVFIGSSGQARITARDLAAASDTIPNEILSRLGPRLRRMWR